MTFNRHAVFWVRLTCTGFHFRLSIWVLKKSGQKWRQQRPWWNVCQVSCSVLPQSPTHSPSRVQTKIYRLTIDSPTDSPRRVWTKIHRLTINSPINSQVECKLRFTDWQLIHHIDSRLKFTNWQLIHQIDWRLRFTDWQLIHQVASRLRFTDWWFTDWQLQISFVCTRNAKIFKEIA